MAMVISSFDISCTSPTIKKPPAQGGQGRPETIQYAGETYTFDRSLLLLICSTHVPIVLVPQRSVHCDGVDFPYLQ
jgi:hypothetical protein